MSAGWCPECGRALHNPKVNGSADCPVHGCVWANWEPPKVVPNPDVRTVLVHLNVEPADDDTRSATEIGAAIAAALEVGSDDDSVRELTVVVAMAEDI